MVAQVGALRVTVGADITGLQTGMARAQREVKRGAAGMQQSVASVTTSFKSLAAAAGIGFGIAGVLTGARALLRVADASKQLQAQLRLATQEYGNFGQANKDVQRIAETTRTGLSETANLYAVFQRNAKELGITQEQSARATETVNKTFQISGASAAEAAGGLRQFLQALQSGQLRGEEFNSVMENAPRLARLLADSLGVTIGQLRAMAKEGEITGDKLVAALTDRKFTEQIDREFQQLPVTFDQAMGQVYNAAVVTFGAFDQGGQFSTALANFITGGTQGFADLEKAAYDFGASLRGLFDTLDSIRAAFGSLQTAGVGALLGIEGATFSLRDALSGVLGVVDGMANAFANLFNAPGNLIRGALGQNLVLDPVNTRGAFRRSVGAADLRRIAGQGLDPGEWPGRAPPAFRPPSAGGGGKKGRSGPSAESLAKKAQQEMEQRLRRDAQYDSERRRNQIEILQADRELTASAAEQADISHRILDLQREQELADLALAVKLGDRTEVEAQALEVQIRDLDQLKHRALDLEQERQQREDAARLEDARFDVIQDQLRAESSLATTASEARDIQLRILDIEYQRERTALERLIADQESTEAAKKEARLRLAALDARYGAERQGVMAQTRNPLEAWAATVPKTAAEITEALQGITANGLDGISDAIASIIDGSKSMADAFGDAAKAIINDLIQMFTRMLMFQALQAAFPGMFGGAAMPTPQFPAPRALGGPVVPGRTYRVGEQGPELIRVGSRGQVIPNSEIGGGSARVIVELRDEMLSARIAEGAGQVVMRAAPALRADAVRAVGEKNRRAG